MNGVQLFETISISVTLAHSNLLSKKKRYTKKRKEDPAAEGEREEEAEDEKRIDLKGEPHNHNAALGFGLPAK